MCKDKKGTGMQAKKMRDRKKVYQKTLLGCLVPARPAVQVTPQITGLCNQEKKTKKTTAYDACLDIDSTNLPRKTKKLSIQR